jgi:hypothetical protein
MVASSTLQVCPYIYTVRSSAYKCSSRRFLRFLKSWLWEGIGRIVEESLGERGFTQENQGCVRDGMSSGALRLRRRADRGLGRMRGRLAGTAGGQNMWGGPEETEFPGREPGGLVLSATAKGRGHPHYRAATLFGC